MRKKSNEVVESMMLTKMYESACENNARLLEKVEKVIDLLSENLQETRMLVKALNSMPASVKSTKKAILLVQYTLIPIIAGLVSIIIFLIR